jgi:dihydroneopterin aldolase
MDHIRITGLSLDMIIGVHAWERVAPRRLVFDLDLGLDTRKAGASDDVSDAVDYAAVCERVRALCLETNADNAPALLESLLERLAARLLADFPPVQSVDLKVQKPGAVQGVGIAVSIQRLRAAPNQ